MLHREFIALLGMVIGELWKLDEWAELCAAEGVYKFILTAKPLACDLRRRLGTERPRHQRESHAILWEEHVSWCLIGPMSARR